ncbi:MAG TPA: hypothetical protein VHM90_09915 [Phycisphaerae bacterium]|nr:hypothetical protein [Phycisphaerae bacterium]
MPRYFALHSIGPNVVTRQMVEDAGAHARLQNEIPGYRSFINMSEGHAACVIDAPSKEWLLEYFKSLNLPVNALFEIEIETLNGTTQPPGAELCPPSTSK